MRLLILGANGKTGTQLVDLALARGHEVTAFVRSPAKVTRRHPLLRVRSCSRPLAFVRRKRSARTP
jgi:putative NADH-flavin reductase